MPPTFAPLEEAMLDACAEIAATAPDPWQRAALARALADENRRCFVAVSNTQPIALACFMAVCGSADLEMLAVRPSCRRQGVAKALLGHALGVLQRQGVQRVLLEARASNAAAIGLYRQLGFAVLANRPALYAHPREDGVLMAVSLTTT